MSKSAKIPSNALGVYKCIIDDLAEDLDPTSARTVRKEGRYSRALGARFKTNSSDLFPRVSEKFSLTCLRAREGIGRVLADLAWWTSCHDLELTFKGEKLPVDFAEGIIGDWVGRCDRWQWPDDSGKQRRPSRKKN